MRNLRNPQLERGEVRIEDIELDIKCRDDVPALLSGLQYLYSQEAFRDRLFALMDEYILPGVNRKVGRPGMSMWSILVMGVVKQGLGCDIRPAFFPQKAGQNHPRKLGVAKSMIYTPFQ